MISTWCSFICREFSTLCSDSFFEVHYSWKDGPTGVLLFSVYIKHSFNPTKGSYWEERLPARGHILQPPRILTRVHLNISFLKDAAFLDAAVREREEELSRRTLQALLDMRIKFPGKSDEEAEVILDSVSVGHYAGYFWSFGKSLNKFILEA